MDSSTPNAEVMERYVESLEHNDWQAATALWAEDSSFTSRAGTLSRETSSAKKLSWSTTVGSPPSLVAP